MDYEFISESIPTGDAKAPCSFCFAEHDFPCKGAWCVVKEHGRCAALEEWNEHKTVVVLTKKSIKLNPLLKNVF